MAKQCSSAIKDERLSFEADLGVEDRARLDQYFTSLRQMEQQVEMQLVKPEPLAACSRPKDPGADTGVNDQLDVSVATHKVMGQLLAHALLCDQTRSARIMFSIRPGLRVWRLDDYHPYRIRSLPPSAGEVSLFSRHTMAQAAEFIKMLDSFKEVTARCRPVVVVLNTDNVRHSPSADQPSDIYGGRAGG